MNAVLLMLIEVAGARVVSLVMLALRLRRQVVRDRLRCETLTVLAERLPAEGTAANDPA